VPKTSAHLTCLVSKEKNMDGARSGRAELVWETMTRRVRPFSLPQEEKQALRTSEGKNFSLLITWKPSQVSERHRQKGTSSGRHYNGLSDLKHGTREKSLDPTLQCVWGSLGFAAFKALASRLLSSQGTRGCYDH
jgi:hypothetical protein